MLDIGWSELLVIGLVALIVVGPKDLPIMFRTLGRFTARARSMAREFQRAMDEAAKASGVHEAMKDVKDATSKKSLGITALEQAADKFEKWSPLDPVTKPAPKKPSPTPTLASPAAATAAAAAAASAGPTERASESAAESAPEAAAAPDPFLQMPPELEPQPARKPRARKAAAPEAASAPAVAEARAPRRKAARTETGTGEA